MSVRITVPYASGFTLTWSVTRMSDGLNFDFADGTFKTTPGTPTQTMTEGTSPYRGEYTGLVSSPTVNQWIDGHYKFRTHNGLGGDVLGLFYQYIESQSDLTAPQGSIANPALIQLSQALTNRTDGTVGGALHGSYAMAWTESVKSVILKTLTLIGLGSTGSPAKVFDLDNANNPTRKTPR